MRIFRLPFTFPTCHRHASSAPAAFPALCDSDDGTLWMGQDLEAGFELEFLLAVSGEGHYQTVCVLAP